MILDVIILALGIGYSYFVDLGTWWIGGSEGLV